MEEGQRNTRRRIYTLEPNALVYAGFSHKYMSYLLPALFKATSNITPYCRNKDNKIEKMVRLEVDMALVLSTGGFRWSHALKHKLEQCMNARNSNTISTALPSPPAAAANILVTSKRRHNHFSFARKVGHLHQLFPAIPRPLKLDPKPRKSNDEFRCRLRILRRILPGGSDMNLHELLSEVESYVVCLQLQVNVLRSLVDTV